MVVREEREDKGLRGMQTVGKEETVVNLRTIKIQGIRVLYVICTV